MAVTNLNLPAFLKTEAEEWASRQGVSFEEFVVWAIAEKVGELKQVLDDPRFPHITYRRGASGWPVAVIRGTSIRVETIVVASKSWGMSPTQIAEDYELPPEQIQEAMAFYAAHRGEIEASLADARQTESIHA